MEEEQQKQPNRYIEYIKKNKYSIYFVVTIAILLFLIIAIITITVSNNSTKTIYVGPTKTPTQDSQTPPIIPISKSTSANSITTPNPTQAALMENQTQPQIAPKIAVQYTVPAIKHYDNNWAIMKLSNPDVGSATVIVKKVKGAWKVMLGPGTHFDQQDLEKIGAPQEILNDANTGM